ncbi:hypothetical protein F5Y13DRAFT_21800 [Hypoxylon sp. FL1857]|nr:hypothetical protein F5Y13DRAFT_21800 [Hypoxylon sp. FL1857]
MKGQTKRIFHDSKVQIDCTLVFRDKKGSTKPLITTRKISKLDELRNKDPNQRDKHELLFIFIPQLSSWGRLLITTDVFLQLVLSLLVFPAFLYVVREFGLKVRDGFLKGHVFSSQYCRCAKSSAYSLENKHHSYEISYLLHFVEENGRARGDPWSLRQTGIYQQVDANNDQSIWVILQISKATRERLMKKLHHPELSSQCPDNPMSIHAVLLLATVDNWGAYIEYLRSQLIYVDEKVCYSSIGKVSPTDYAIEFSDLQKLHSLRNTLLYTQNILNSCLNISTKINDHYQCLRDLDLQPDCQRTILSLQSYSADISVYVQSVATVLKSLHGTLDLLSKIVEFRNAENLRLITAASERSISELRVVTSRIQEENRTSAVMSVKSHREAKAVKVLTTVSLAFLPASLIATIFSSSLVQVKQVGSSNTQFAVASQFWIFALASIFLTFITLGCTYLLERYVIRKPSPLPSQGAI